MRVIDFPLPQQSVLLAIGCQPNQKVFSFNGYPAVCLNRQPRYVHRLVAQHILGVVLSRGIQVHHVDHDATNFLPSNLHTCTLGEHNTHHRRSGTANHFFGKQHTEQSRALISASAKSRTTVTATESTRLVLSLHARARARRADGTQRFSGACA